MCKVVIKRDGREEPFNPGKIKRQIEFATKNTTINPIEFEAKFHAYLPEKVKTSEIQEILLQTAIKEISVDNPDWEIVAGRLAMWDIYSRVYKNTGIKFSNWLTLIEYLTDKGYYTEDVIRKLRELNIKDEDIYYGTWKNIDINKHPDFNKLIRQSLIELDRYLVKNINGPIEYLFISHIANAVLLADNRDDFFTKYKYLSEEFISLATPFKKNLRRGGNTGSCFIGVMDDNLPSILKSISDMSIISQEGGGVGWDISKLRPSNSYSGNVPKSNPITHWTKIINDIAVAVNQRGTRAAAITVGMRWWHLDVQDFIEARVETKSDIRSKTFEIFPQPIVDNYFMKKVKNKEYVYQFNHYYFKKLTGIDITELFGEEYYRALELAERLCKEGKLTHYRKIKANNLWSKFLWHWIEIGSMYIANFDNLNKSNYLKNETNKERRLFTPMSNLCNESFSVCKVATTWKTECKNEKLKTTETDGMYHSCNLISINLVKCVDLTDDEYYDVVYHAVDMLDKSIDLTSYPVKEAEYGSRRLRNIGIGFLGLADVMAYKGLMYDTEEGRRFGAAEAERLTYYAYKASVELAKKRGSYPWFNPDNYDTLLGEDPKELNRLSKEYTGNNFDWVGLQQDIKKYGIRNFLLTAIAPNTSTSLVMGVMPSYLPVFNKFYYETLSGLNIPILPRFIKEKYWYYKTRTQYKVTDLIKFTRALQKFIDTGISMELNMNPNLNTIDEISNEIIDGFLSGDLKAVYYSTTLDRESKKDNKKQECIDCAN